MYKLSPTFEQSRNILEDCMQDAILYTLTKFKIVEGKENNALIYCINKYNNLKLDYLKHRNVVEKYINKRRNSKFVVKINGVITDEYLLCL